MNSLPLVTGDMGRLKDKSAAVDVFSTPLGLDVSLLPKLKFKPSRSAELALLLVRIKIPINMTSVNSTVHELL